MIAAAAFFLALGLEPQHERALAVLEEARRVARHGGERIWPGFALERIPIALFDDEVALLVHHPEPPADFAAVESDAVTTPVLRGARTPAMNANTAGELGGAVTAFVSLGSIASGGAGVPGEAGDASAVALIVHEAAHAFRLRTPEGGAPRWAAEDAGLAALYPAASAANNAWGRIEGALLRDALEASSPELRRRLARDFVEVRGRRQRDLAPEIVRFEHGLERNEGLAEYFAWKALELAGSYEPHLERLREDLARINAGGRGASRERFYLTGAAQGLLLDRLGAPWKRAIEEGGDLSAELARAVHPAEPAPADLDRIAAERDFDALLRHERLAADAAVALRRKKLVDLLAAPGRKLVLDLSAAGGAEDVRLFDPLNLVAVEPGLRVHTRMLRLGFRGGEAAFERAVVQDVDRALAISALPEDAELELDAATGAARVTANGIAVACRDASWVEDAEALVLRPGGRGAALDPAPIRALLAAARAEARKPRPAPPFEARDLAGALHRHPEEEPRPTALVFFSAAEWAEPGRRFVRELLAALPPERGTARSLLVASQCTGAELDELLGDAAREGVIHDRDRMLAGLLGVERYPTVVWIDADGTVGSFVEGYAEDGVRSLVVRLGE